jgi:hypothetical protein
MGNCGEVIFRRAGFPESPIGISWNRAWTLGACPTNDWDFLRETNPAKMPRFDAVVANPPFSYRWEPGDAMSEDMRFKNHGVAP